MLHRLDHPRLIALHFDGTPDTIRAGLARHGKPVQYAHLREPLKLWDVWTSVAARPVAFEPPSAGFVLDWQLLHALRERGVEFATLTHAAGLSSTGDAELDARLPFDEPYHLPAATILAIQRAHARGARVVALGTTVTRALEHGAVTRRRRALRAWLSHPRVRRFGVDRRLDQPRSNLNTATLARRFGQRRTAAPFLMPNASRMRSPSLRASTSKSA